MIAALSAYQATFSGFRDGDPAASWPFDDDCVIFRVRDTSTGKFCWFDAGGHKVTIDALYLREHDHTGAVEWHDDFDYDNYTPVADLPASWPQPLCDFLITSV